MNILKKTFLFINYNNNEWSGLSFSELQAIESKKPNQIVFRIHDKSLSFRPSVESGTSEVVDSMISTLARAVRSIFPGVMLSQVIAKVRSVVWWIRWIVFSCWYCNLMSSWMINFCKPGPVKEIWLDMLAKLHILIAFNEIKLAFFDQQLLNLLDGSRKDKHF